MNWKSTAALSGVTLLATWLGSTPVPEVGEPVPAPGSTPEQARASDIEVQAQRLQSRDRAESGYHVPARNPFRFGARQAPAATPRATAPVVTSAAPVPFADLRSYAVVGIATERTEGEEIRTAIVSAGADVLFIRTGDQIGSYTITQVDDNGLQVTGPEGITRLELARP